MSRQTFAIDALSATDAGLTLSWGGPDTLALDPMPVALTLKDSKSPGLAVSEFCRRPQIEVAVSGLKEVLLKTWPSGVEGDQGKTHREGRIKGAVGGGTDA